jgi:hypothetical protein
MPAKKQSLSKAANDNARPKLSPGLTPYFLEREMISSSSSSL